MAVGFRMLAATALVAVQASLALPVSGEPTRDGVPSIASLARADAMPADAGAGAVSFVFATREEGHEILLTEVHVRMVHAVDGARFEGVSDGPFLEANVPAGDYDVTASHEGRSQRVGLTVARGATSTLKLYW